MSRSSGVNLQMKILSVSAFVPGRKEKLCHSPREIINHLTLFYSLTAFTTPRPVPSNIFTSQLRGGKYFLWWREWNIFILDEIVYGVGLCRDLLELNIQTEQIITPRRHRRPDLSRTLFSSSKNNKSGARAQPGTHQLRLFKYETGFHSDSSGNIISEIIVKADFDLTFIRRRKKKREF